jgi:hypothetical protein
MIGLSAACLYTLIEYAPWRKVEVEWTQAGEQWGLGQILSIFTLAPVVVEVIMSAQWSSDGSQNVAKEGGTNVLRYLRNRKRRVVARHLLARQGAQLEEHEMGGVTDPRALLPSAAMDGDGGDSPERAV